MFRNLDINLIVFGVGVWYSQGLKFDSPQCQFQLALWLLQKKNLIMFDNRKDYACKDARERK